MPGNRRLRTFSQRPSERPRLESYPHPYPDGWYRLSNSAELRPKQVRYIECLGRQFVLWRAENGRAHVMPAFCPHLGGNLSLGRVRGDCIECPFHRWQFTGEGRVARVPYSDHLPEGILTQPLPVQEVHGQLFVYHDHHTENHEFGYEPPYSVPNIPEVDDGRFAFRGSYNPGRVLMHILEFAENSADQAHFKPVHGKMRFPWTQLRVPGISIDHELDWHLDPDVSWKMYFIDNASLSIFGRRVQSWDARGRVTFYGPGSLVKFRFTIKNRGDIEMYQTHLPISPMEQEVNFRWFADRRLPRLLVWYVIGNWISQWRRDIIIWENKIYQRHPRLCRDDGPVLRLRHWYRQFLPPEEQ